jgi:hypothetical protein
MNPVGYENPPTDAYYPTGFPQMWKDIVDHIDQGCIGGVFFEYTDELWKSFGRQSLLGVSRGEDQGTERLTQKHIR